LALFVLVGSEASLIYASGMKNLLKSGDAFSDYPEINHLTIERQKKRK
jgi:hypothetical protein